MVAHNRRLYEQKDYDCQRCGAPEDDAMRKRVMDFIRPMCDPCIQAAGHEGHHPDEVVVVGSTTGGHDPASGKPTRQHTERRVRYGDWEFRCGACVGSGS